MTLNFTDCESLSCTSVPIFDDDDVPEYEESYILSLVRPPGLDSWVGLSSETLVITVIDDDGKLSNHYCK